MSIPISSLPPLQQIPQINPVQPGNAGSGEFQKVLQSAIQDVEASRTSADAAVKGFLAGDNQELHSTILATQKAELQFELFMQVRNKVVSAYEEIMRMQL
jgi:flagellar hook-basal body complex protein FliE